MDSWISASLSEAGTWVAWLADLEKQTGIVERMGTHLATCLSSNGRIFTCGNGGSMCDAMHMAEELTGRFRRDRPAWAAQAISDPAHISCVGNDYGYQHVFARAIEAWGRAGDTLVAFSTSGNSPNILLAVSAARARGVSIIGLLGRDGGQVAAACDVSLIVPAQTSDRIQEVHIKVVHLLIEFVERRLVPDNYISRSPNDVPAR